MPILKRRFRELYPVEGGEYRQQFSATAVGNVRPRHDVGDTDEFEFARLEPGSLVGQLRVSSAFTAMI